jgi:hypothetical protein
MQPTERAALVWLVLAGLAMMLAGCDNPMDLLGQATGYTASVSANMRLRGWEGFPSTPLALVHYMRDLAAAVGDAKAGVVAEGLGDGGDAHGPRLRGSREDSQATRALGEAFRIPGQGGER